MRWAASSARGRPLHSAKPSCTDALRGKEKARLKDVKIGRRLALGFGLVLLLMAAVSGAAWWGLETIDAMARDVLTVSYPLVDHSEEARSVTLSLRRYEKDYFLNIGALDKEAEYLGKWKEQRQRLDES